MPSVLGGTQRALTGLTNLVFRALRLPGFAQGEEEDTLVHQILTEVAGPLILVPTGIILFRYRRSLNAQQIAHEPALLALVSPPHGPPSPTAPQELPALVLPPPAELSLDLPTSEVPDPSGFTPVSPASSATSDQEGSEPTGLAGVVEEAPSTAAPELRPISPSSPVPDPRMEEEGGGEAGPPSGDLQLALAQALPSTTGPSTADSMAIMAEEGADEAAPGQEGSGQGEGEELEVVEVEDSTVPVVAAPTAIVADEAGTSAPSAPVLLDEGEGAHDDSVEDLLREVHLHPSSPHSPLPSPTVPVVAATVIATKGDEGEEVAQAEKAGQGEGEPQAVAAIARPFGDRPPVVWDLVKSLGVTVGTATCVMGSFKDLHAPDLLSDIAARLADRPAVWFLVKSLGVTVGRAKGVMGSFKTIDAPDLPPRIMQRLAGIRKGGVKEAGAVGVGQEGGGDATGRSDVLQVPPSLSGHTTSAVGTAVAGGEAASEGRGGLVEAESVIAEVPMGPSSSVQVNSALPNAGMAQANETVGVAPMVQLQTGEEQMGSQPVVAVVEARGGGAIAGGAEVGGGGGQGTAGQKPLTAKEKRLLIKAANKQAKLEAARAEHARQRELAATAPQEAREREAMEKEEEVSQRAEQAHRAAVALDTIVRAAPQEPAVADLCCPLTGVLLTDPVQVGDGCAYQRAAIKHHMDLCRTAGRPYTSPLTNSTISPLFVPLSGVRARVLQYLVSQSG